MNTYDDPTPLFVTDRAYYEARGMLDADGTLREDVWRDKIAGAAMVAARSGRGVHERHSLPVSHAWLRSGVGCPGRNVHAGYPERWYSPIKVDGVPWGGSSIPHRQDLALRKTQKVKAASWPNNPWQWPIRVNRWNRKGVWLNG